MSEMTRRGAIHAVGASAVAGAVLTGCADASDQVAHAASSVASQAGEAVSSAGSAATSAAASAAGELVKAAEIPVGGGKILTLLKVVITQPTEGDFKAFSSICPHQGCPVTGVADGVITCPCHGSTFDIATGAVKKGPATSGLSPKSVSVTADGITVT